MNTLSPRQRDALRVIQRSLEERGYPPSVREVARDLKVTPRAAQKHIDALEKKGHLTRGRGSRALGLVQNGYGRAVPVVGQVAAGRPILAEENIDDRLTLDPSVARWKDCFLLKVKGESMTGAGILDGDLVLVKPQPEAESGEIVVAMLDGEATVKRLVTKGGAVTLQAENPRFPPIAVTPESAYAIVGKVVGLCRF